MCIYVLYMEKESTNVGRSAFKRVAMEAHKNRKSRTVKVLEESLVACSKARRRRSLSCGPGSIPLNPDWKYVNKSTRGSAGWMPTLYSPSKKYFNRNDSSFHGAPSELLFLLQKEEEEALSLLLAPLAPLLLCLKKRTHRQDTRIFSLSLFLLLSSSAPLSTAFRFQFLPDFAEFRPKGFRFYLGDAGAPCLGLGSFCSLEILCEWIQRWISRNLSVHLLSHNFFFETSPSVLLSLIPMLPRDFQRSCWNLAREPFVSELRSRSKPSGALLFAALSREKDSSCRNDPLAFSAGFFSAFFRTTTISSWSSMSHYVRAAGISGEFHTLPLCTFLLLLLLLLLLCFLYLLVSRFGLDKVVRLLYFKRLEIWRKLLISLASIEPDEMR